jgi:hypothetical protein
VKKTVLAGRALVAVTLCLASGALASPAERNRFVRVPAQAAGAVAALDLRPVRDFDFGAFRWLELTASDHAALGRAGIAFEADDDAGTLAVAGVRFDPRADGEPWMPAGLRSDGTGRELRLVQLAGPADDARRAALERTGARVLQYYPHNAYLVWGGPAEAAAAEALDFVRWQGPLHPAWKIAPGLLAMAGVISNVDVTVYDDGRFDDTLSLLSALGAQVLQHHAAQPDGAFRDVIVRLPAEALDSVARIPAVWALGYQGPRPVLDDEMSSQIVAGNYSGTPPAPFVGYMNWLAAIGQNGTAVRWAVVDTGVDYQHPDLNTHIAGGYSFPGACNPAGEPGSDCSGGGHGTHVAGIIGGDATGLFADGQGFKYGLGMAPEYEIFAMNSLSASAWPPTGGWQEHSKRAVLGGAMGGNNSWTTGEGTNHGYQASERTHDIMVRDGNFDTATVAEPFIEVFSAGNSGPGTNTLTSPKEGKNLIVVANSLNTRAGNMDAISSSSSRGPAADGRKVPTVAAPGSTIASTRNDLGGSCSTPISGTNNLYALCSGTSMAAPHVSGSIVLLTDWWRDSHAGANPSAAMARALLVNTAVDMTANAAGAIWNNEEGWGRVNLSSIFGTSVRRIFRDQVVSDTFGAAGEVRTFSTALATPGQPLKVTIAWSDAPGAVGANPALVNDLDLTVTAGGATYRGNVFSGGWSTTGGSADRLNNLENVYVQAPAAGAVTITVTAFNVPGDGVPYNADPTDQDFVLVCSNCSSLRPFGLGVDDGAGGNGVLDEAESAQVLTTWRNDAAAPVGPITGTIASSSPITIINANGTYGTIPATGEATASYGVLASGPRPAQHWDAVIDETLSTGEGHAWTVHIGPTFSDVLASPFYRSIETIVHGAVTGGCAPGQYCPDASVTREQMAVFVLTGKEGAGYSPAPCVPPNLFGDVPDTSPFCRFIEELAERGVVAGCAGNLYCPSDPVTREQMAVFVLRTLDPALSPPACVAGSEMFGDVPANSPFCRWIEEMARRGITTGCGGGNYCPADPNTRGEMAVFLTTAFGLTLYTP